MNPFREALDHRKVIENELNDFIDYYRGDQIREVKSLADKISHMVCNIGCPTSVMPMLESIVKGKLKTWVTQICDDHGKKLNPRMHIAEKDRKYSDGTSVLKEGASGQYKNDYYLKVSEGDKNYSKGHFRWDWTAYTIDRETRDYIKMFLIDKNMEDVKKYVKDNEGRRKLRMGVRNMQVQKYSDNCYTIEITTPKGNEFRYHYYPKDGIVSTNCDYQTPISPFEEHWVKTTIRNNYDSSRGCLKDHKYLKSA
jgi:hypothetical protein